MVLGFMQAGLERYLRLFPLALIFCISPGVASGAAVLDKVVAVVNKDVVTWSELSRAMDFEASSQMKSLSDVDRKRIFKENEKRFLEKMIDEKLEMQAAKALGIEATKEEISDAIEGIKKKYKMDDKAFEESLEKEGFNLKEYKKRLNDQIILTKLIGQQVKNKIVISDKEIEEYMAKNKDDEYRVRQIFFKRSDKGGDDEALQKKAEEVMQRLRNGEEFALLAMSYSDDPSGKSGGEMGFIKKEYMGKEFLAVLSKMPVGAISAPFWTGRGLHIIQLEDKIDAGNADEFRAVVKQKLFEKRFDEAYRNWIRGLREKAYVEVRL